MVKTLLRFEGLTFFIISLIIYWQIDGSWLLFLILFLTPDISMLGYFKNKNLGAYTYNLMHNYILAVIIGLIGFLTNNQIILQIGIILFAHVSIDRFFGYGLKFPSNFKDTHIQRV